MNNYQIVFSASTKLPLSPERAEEHKRIGIEYNKRKMMRNNMVDKDISNKIWLQQEAMRALPMDLRQKAEVIDQSSPPVDRVMPLWDTPPIKGFNVDDYIQKKEEEEEEI